MKQKHGSTLVQAFRRSVGFYISRIYKPRQRCSRREAIAAV
ncbi:hypothetical protein [Funiculus sociatus]